MSSKKIIVLGIGNSILGDDGIGLRIVEDLSQYMKENIDFIQTEEMGFGLLDFLTGYDLAIIIDSVQTGGIPGSINIFSIRDFKPEQSLSNHYVGLPQLAQMAGQLNIKFPAAHKLPKNCKFLQIENFFWNVNLFSKNFKFSKKIEN